MSFKVRQVLPKLSAFVKNLSLGANGRSMRIIAG